MKMSGSGEDFETLPALHKTEILPNQIDTRTNWRGLKAFILRIALPPRLY